MIVLLIVLEVATFVVLIITAKWRDVSPLLAVSLFFAFFQWYVTPVVTTLVAPERLAGRMVVVVDRFVDFATIEVAAFLLTLTIFCFGARRFRIIANGRFARFVLPPRVLALAVGAGLIAFIAVRWKTIAITGATYEEVNAFAIVGQGTAEAGAVGLLVFLDGLLLAFAAACAVTPREHMRVTRVMVWLWIAGAALSTVMIGGRLALLTPCALLLMALHERRPSRGVILATYAGLVTVVATAGVLLTLVIANIRGSEAITLSGVSQESKAIVEQRSMLSERLWEFFDHLNIKFDAISAGAYLVDHYGYGEAGWRPYAGALLALVPRAIAGSKPVPGSIDGTARGTPSRLVANALGYDADVGNVGVSPAATSIWQFGILGLIPLVILNVLNLRLINSLLLRPSVPSRTLAMFLIGVPAFVGVFSVGDLIIMNTERALAIYAAGTVLVGMFGQSPVPEFVHRQDALS
jgi:hypothetical protein